MKGYGTVQRKRLLDFLENHCDQQFTVQEIFSALEDVSLSAVYRNVSKMVENGCIQRFPKPGSTEFLYQYVATHHCADHVHVKCERCGDIAHLDEKVERLITQLLMSEQDFTIDPSKTMLFGICRECSA